MQIFKRLMPHKAENTTPAILRRIDREFQKRTESVSDDVWDVGDFLMLLNLAENRKPLGKSKAIIYAIKIGYLTGKRGVDE